MPQIEVQQSKKNEKVQEQRGALKKIRKLSEWMKKVRKDVLPCMRSQLCLFVFEQSQGSSGQGQAEGSKMEGIETIK